MSDALEMDWIELKIRCSHWLKFFLYICLVLVMHVHIDELVRQKTVLLACLLQMPSWKASRPCSNDCNSIAKIFDLQPNRFVYKSHFIDKFEISHAKYMFYPIEYENKKSKKKKTEREENRYNCIHRTTEWRCDCCNLPIILFSVRLLCLFVIVRKFALVQGSNCLIALRKILSNKWFN